MVTSAGGTYDFFKLIADFFRESEIIRKDRRES